MWFRKQRTPEQEFWHWFQKSSFISVEGEQLVSRLGERVKVVHEHIVFEVGPTDQRPRELIISADGIREAIASVESLADSAPPMRDWLITRFRPRLSAVKEFELQFGQITANAKNMRFVARRVGVLVDIAIFADWYDDAERKPDGAAFIMLDMALGEYDVMCRVGHIKMYPLINAPQEARAWEELPIAFDQLSNK